MSELAPDRAASTARSSTTQSFAGTLAAHGQELRRGQLGTVQVNLGLVCNQACAHCHHDAGPVQTAAMDRPTAERVLELVAGEPGIHTVDLTGGAPELNPHFRFLVEGLYRAGKRIIDRCNLTVLLQGGQTDTIAFLARHKVRIIASLPCYLAANVDAQRGSQVYVASMAALRLLNLAGYGRPDGELVLDLVYNPSGPELAPEQGGLERDYRRELQTRWGIVFNNLLTLNNMPIKRYETWLRRNGQYEAYLATLADSFNPAAVPLLMCRSQLTIGWDGHLADCDFNLALGLGLDGGELNIHQIARLSDIGAGIAVGSHCHACAAGHGSSCQGALA